MEAITDISTTFNSLRQYSIDLGKVEVKYDSDIYEYMSQDVVNNETHENEERFIVPFSRNFNFDRTVVPLPEGTLKFDYAKDDGNANVFVQWMYQHAALAAKGDKSTLSDVFEGATFVGFSGIFESLAKCIYDPGVRDEEGNVVGNTADFKMTATKIGGVIFMNWNNESRLEPVGGDQNPKSYRFARSIVSYGSFLKPKTMSIVTIALTDIYKEDGTPVDVIWSPSTSAEYWNDSNKNINRSLQQYLKMIVCGFGTIKYELAEGEEEKTRDELFDIGHAEENGRRRGLEIYKNMKTFLTKVLSEVKEHLNEGNYCEIEFNRENINRSERGSGQFTITYKGNIEGPVLLSEFKNVFNL